jgi:hypothetical protein
VGAIPLRNNRHVGEPITGFVFNDSDLLMEDALWKQELSSGTLNLNLFLAFRNHADVSTWFGSEVAPV